LTLTRQERQKNPNVLVCGITAWEMSKPHPSWSEFFHAVDLIMVPCLWNKQVFEQVTRVPMYRVLTPVDKLESIDSDYDLGLPDEKAFGFYTIADCNPRKGIEDLIKCYLRTFTSDDPVVLYIKTNADRTVTEGYIADHSPSSRIQLQSF